MLQTAHAKMKSQMNAAIPERRSATEEISGLIERVTFHNDDSGFCVLRVKARGQREETTAVGSQPSLHKRALRKLGHGSVGFLAMHKARFRGHAYAGSRLRV